MDPLTKDYPMLTPYQFAGNTPIQAIDLDGLEPVQSVQHNNLYSSSLQVPNTGDGNYYGDAWYYQKVKGENSSIQDYWVRSKLTNWYGDRIYEYWDGSDYISFKPNGYIEQYQGTLAINAGLQRFGEKGVQLTYGIVLTGATFGAASAYASATGVGVLSTQMLLRERVISGALDFSFQYAAVEGNINKINFASTGSSVLFANPFTSPYIGNLINIDTKLNTKINIYDAGLNGLTNGIFNVGGIKALNYLDNSNVGSPTMNGLGIGTLNEALNYIPSAMEDQNLGLKAATKKYFSESNNLSKSE